METSRRIKLSKGLVVGQSKAGNFLLMDSTSSPRAEALGQAHHEREPLDRLTTSGSPLMVDSRGGFETRPYEHLGQAH